MISKELLSEALDIEIKEIGKLVEGSLLSFRYPTHWGYCNIYELANKCKEWAFDKFGIYVSSEIGEDSKAGKFWTARLKLNDEHYSFWEDTEPEAIFKACEWILKESK